MTRPSATRRLLIVGSISKTPFLVFAGVTVEVEDIRKNYAERRVICYGTLEGRVVVIGYTPRGAVRHIFSMRKANNREQARLAPYLEV
jgi:uncharacterized DUF497 family protein